MSSRWHCCLGLALCIGQIALSQSWENRNGRPTDRSVHDVFAQDENTLWAVGEAGLVLKSENGGISWQHRAAATVQDLWYCFFLDEQRGWAVGSDRVVIRTTNGGATWTQSELHTSGQWEFITFTSDSVGWRVGANDIERTADGGESWQPRGSGGSDAYFCAAFLSDSVGFAGGRVADRAYIRRTADAGQQWSDIYLGDLDEWINNLYFLDNTYGWAVGSHGLVVRTTDGGASWENLPGMSGPSIFDVHFTTPDSGWVVNAAGGIRFTSDSGYTWTGVFDSEASNLRALTVLSSSAGWAVGSYGSIARMISPANWFAPAIPIVGLNSVWFWDDSTGWVAGADRAIWKTGNAGGSWDGIYSMPTDMISDLHFIPESFGFASTTYGEVLRTIDGETWNVVYLDTGYAVDALCARGNRVWTCGRGGHIRGSNSGGDEFEARSVPVTHWLRDIYFIDESFGCCVGDSGTILMTGDGGELWTQGPPITGAGLSSVYFMDQQRGWVCGTSGVVCKTSDGGVTWDLVETGFAYALNAIYFPNLNQGLAVGAHGSILYTADGGETWQPYFTGSDNALTDLRFPDNMTGWAAGYGGQVWRISLPAFAGDKRSPLVPDEFSLTAYPNPFNPTTTLQFRIPSATRAEIAIFDITGRFVQSLYSGTMDAGSHSIRYNASNIASGTYLVRLISPLHASTLPITLIR